MTFFSHLLKRFRLSTKCRPTIYSYILGRLFYFSWKVTTLPVHDHAATPPRLQPKIWGSRPPNSQHWRLWWSWWL